MKLARLALVRFVFLTVALSTVGLTAEVLLVASGRSGSARIDLYDSETFAVLKKNYISGPPLSYVSGLIYDSSGLLFTTSGLAGRTAVFNTNPPSVRNASLISPVVAPYGMAMDSSGLLYLTNNSIAKIFVYRKDGTFVRDFSVSTPKNSDSAYALHCTSNDILFMAGTAAGDDS